MPPCLGGDCLGLRNARLNGSLFGDFLKGLAGGERCGPADQLLPAPDGDIDISGVDFERPNLAAGSLRRNEDGAPATKRLQDIIAFFVPTLYRTRDKANTFHA